MANLATINNNILADSGIDPLSLIVGTGTVNYVPKFTAEDTVANSQIFDNGTDVGIGTSSPFVKFDVRGEAMLLYRPAGNAYAIYSAANNTYSWQFGINNGSDYVICGGGFTGLGVEAFRITLGGNVGIGTTSPVTKLDVNGAGVIRGFLTTTDAIKLGGNTSAPTSTDAFIYRPADNTLAFGTASAERMRLDVSGNLLIGLSSALANGKLQVAGSIGLSGNTQIRQATNSDGNTLQVFATQVIAGNLNSYSYGYSGGGLLASVSAGDSILLFDAGRTTSTEGRVKIANTTLGNVSFSVEKNGVTTLFASTLGNVGIGSANPQVKLDVQSGSIGAYHNTASSGGAQLYLGDMNFAGGAYATSAPGVGAVYGPTHLVAGDLAFYVYNGVASSRSEAMRIIRHSSGNNYVGIGTTTPTTKLHVLSSDNTYANLVIAATSNNGNVTGGLTFGGLYNSDALNFYTGASSTTKMYISNAGNVGIGTTSPANIGTGYTTLDIQGTNGGGMAFGTATKSYIYGAATMYLEANTTLLMTTSGSERMRITSGGSVGIGTSSPQARLQVTNSTSDGIIVSTTANVEPFLAFWRNSASNGVGVLRLIDGGNLYFDNGATGAAQATKMQIAATGAVRINSYGAGSFTGTRAYDLSVDASGNIIEVPVGAGTITGSGTTNYIPKWTSSSAIGNSDLITDGSGNLAVAQGNAPTQALNIYRAGSTQTVMAAGNSNTGLNGTYFGVDPNGNGIINTTGAFANIFSTNGSERMRITSGGDIGIGTTAPSYKLDVQEVIRSKYGSNEGRLYLGGTPAGVAYVAGAVRAAPSPSYSYTGKLSFYTTTWGVGTDYGITEQMYIDTTAADTKAATLVMLPWGGNVGIGTTSPTSRLQSDKSSTYNSSTPSGAIIVSNLTGTNAILDIGVDATYLGYIQSRYISNTTYYSLSLNPLGGNVGIGTTSPNSSLEVNRTITFANIDTYGQFVIKTTSGANGKLLNFGVDEANTLSFIQSLYRGIDVMNLVLQRYGGNVGIGVNPSYKLDVNGNVRIGSGTSSLALKITGDDNYIEFDNSGTYIKGGGNLTVSATSNLLLFTGASERMRVTSGGNVGIGTSSPDAIFHVARPNAGGVGGQVVIDNNAGSTLGNTAEISFLTDAGASGAGTRNARIQAVNENVGNGAANMQFWTWNGSAEAERMRITSGGDILVAGTYNPYTAANRGNITLNGTSGVIGFANGTTPRGFIFHDGTNLEIANSLSNPILFATAGNERMRITSGGLVGIGTSSPSDTLHVTGSVRSNSGSSYEVTNHGTFTLNDGTLGNYVDFLVVGSTNVGSSFVELTLSETNIGHGSIKYFIPTNYDDVYVSQTRVVLPLYTTNPRFGYAGGGYGSAIQELQIIANNTGNYTLRLVVRKVGDGSAPAWYWTAKLKNCAVSSTPNTTGINSTVYSLYRHTPLMQYDGKVGIGTSSPGDKLTVNGGIAILAGNSIYFNNPVNTANSSILSPGGGSMSLRSYGVEMIGLSENANILFSTGGTERMRITSGGDVGIGISNPVSKLEVSSTLNSSAFTGITVSNWAGGGAEQSRAGIAFKAYDWVQSAIWHGRNTTGGTDGALVLGTNPDTSNLTVGGVVGRMWIVNNGNVGINQGNPTYKLEVNGNLGSKVGAGEAQVFITNSTSQIYLFNSYAGNTFGIFDGTAGQHRMYYDRGSNFWTFYTGASERMRITSSGDVLVGTTTASFPGASRGNITIGGSSSSILSFQTGGSNRGYLYHDGTGLYLNNFVSGSLSLMTNNTDRLWITSGGDVGIGTSNPAGILDVITNNSATQLVRFYNSNTSGTGASAVRIGNGGNNNDGARLEFSDNNYYVATISGDRSQGIVFRTSATGNNPITIPERMRITSGGLVGIGTTSPSSLLAVGGNPPAAGTISAVSAAGAITLALSDNINSSLYVRNTNGGALIGTDGGGTLRFATGGNTNSEERMRLTSTGELLINTTSDSGDYKLQVNGNGYFNGNLETTVDLVLSRTAVAPAIVTINGNLRLYKSSGAGAQYSLSYDNDTITFSGSIKTAAPSGGTAVPWKLGSRITNTCGTPDTYAGFTSQFLTDKVIEVEINGVTVYIPTVTPGWC